ncbi:putative phosphoenolpyruvate synthase [Uloborus diversus]|uniref:putative phosphoenolpyruvate synthase n=1 Tax=Uloborus diversus TaxID=327109 RepID=UPI00240A715C|nr:putative phosphoenolpyruvate synthase [Uloborus diversus]
MIFETILIILTGLTNIFFSVKWLITRILLHVHKARTPRRFDLYDIYALNDPVKLGFLFPKLEQEVESPYSESHLEHAADEVFIYGVNSSHECFVSRISRGGNGEAEAWIYLKLKDGRTYHLMETLGYEQSYDGRTFSCGGLRLHYVEPMRRWRIFFSGILRETRKDEETPGKNVFVKFALMWKTSSDIFDFKTDMDSGSVAKSMAKTRFKPFFAPPIDQIADTMDFYSQTGIINGTVSIEDNPEYEIYLFGEKVRFLGKSSNCVGSKFKQILGVTPETGFAFHLGEISIPLLFENLPFGFTVEPTGTMKAVTDMNLITKTKSLENSLSAKFTAGKDYCLDGQISGEPIEFKSKKGWKGYMELRYVEFTHRNYKGSGFLLSGEVLEEPKRKQKEAPILKLPEKIPFTVNFTEEISQLTEVTGGKGGSLGKLTHLSNIEKSFVVPKGITVTTSAYFAFLTLQIKKEIKLLEDILYGNSDGDVKTACEKVRSVIVATPLPQVVREDIRKNLSKLFGHEIQDLKFAVRSSATGEDTEQMSAAGQMDTFLGVRGEEDIFEAIKKCWASQFGHIAVEYKRRYGQVLNSPMAVVVQEMVACEVAGVLFTCDPVTSNPSVITITANYGLGESVVSGSEEPDTVFLQREDNDQVSLKSVTLGAKQHRIVMEGDGGVRTEDVPDHERGECCVSNEMAEKLGKISIKIETHCKSPRDIEWGISNNTIYVLQSRPVTSGAGESDYEIKHEFDAPLRCENDYFTVCNTGEVMPGAESPLGLDLTMKVFGPHFRRDAKVKQVSNEFLRSYYYTSGMAAFNNHLMMSVVDLISRMDGHDTMAAKATMIGVFGRIIDDEEIFLIAKERAQEKKRKPIRAHLLMLKSLFYGRSGHKALEKHLHRFDSSDRKYKSSQEAFSAILKNCSEYDESIVQHMFCSEGSMLWNILLFFTLAKNKENFDTDVYSDFARLLSSSSNVLSADVPAAMQNLAYAIVQEMKVEDFRSMTIEDATKWLETTQTSAGVKFREFLKIHGHRCVKEFDVHSVPWEMDTKALVKLLQNLAGTCDKAVGKSDQDYGKIFSELKTPLDFKTRWLIRFLLPNCRRAVGEREQCKSLLIKSMNIWRKGFLTLSKLMVSEGRIPDAELIFFFTLPEIQELLETRSPKLISKAIHRRKLFPALDRYIFPEIMRGLPRPINDESGFEHALSSAADLTMKGIPVSQGVTKGFARVAVTLEEATYVKPGEILITYGTDIGWSPYFPIITGVVTELGGLISHGAVISREYGLPCVVGVQGATRQFQTGDYILLDGNRGVVQRLPKPENE